MKKKDIKLFDKAIHKAKDLIGKIVKQKKELDDDIKELKEIVGELYELFEDLSTGEGN